MPALFGTRSPTRHDFASESQGGAEAAQARRVGNPPRINPRRLPGADEQSEPRDGPRPAPPPPRERP
jgi:hypothetical protein